MIILCPCEQYLTGTNAIIYKTAIYNDNGEIIFAICQHGHIVINYIKKKRRTA
jgi:hypothetical protein